MIRIGTCLQLVLLFALLAACSQAGHGLTSKKSNPLVDDRRVTSSVQLMPVAPYPGLAEAEVAALAGFDVLASTHPGGRRVVQVRGAIENGNLVWRLTTPDGHQLGAVAQTALPGADINELAQAAAPLIVQLLTGIGASSAGAGHPRLALRPVRGPAGIDTRALGQSMAEALEALGVSIGSENVIAELDGDLRIIAGTGTQELVQVEWTLRDLKGRSLGTISQGSPVDRAAIDGTFSALASTIAQAAAPGVVEVIRRRVPELASR